MEELKREYNHNLQRFYNADKYLRQHPEEVDMLLGEVMKIKNKLENILDEIVKEINVTEEETAYGFK